MTIHVGTSGWHYRHWVGLLYPPDLPPHDMLAHYAREFDAVEVNNSFYRLPEPETLAKWRDATPAGFVFAFKASRYLTHMKKLKDPDDALALTMGAARRLGDKLGPVLFQLPPRWHINTVRLTDFLARLPRDIRVVFEFRDPSWFTPATYAVLRKYEASTCFYDLEGTDSPTETTADFVYVRLHGPGAAYEGSYDHTVLTRWAQAVTGWQEDGKDVYLFFNNDLGGHAVDNARELKRLLQS